MKKLGRPTTNPRTEKVGFRMSVKELENIKKCADKLGIQRVDAVVKGIELLMSKLEIEN